MCVQWSTRVKGVAIGTQRSNVSLFPVYTDAHSYTRIQVAQVKRGAEKRGDTVKYKRTLS